MNDNSVNIATLIGSRICHDLISPIGAIGNGLELLDLAGGEQGPELDLISHSVENAGARIQFFRIAFGEAGDQDLGQPEIVSVLDGIGRGGRLRIHWVPTGPLPRTGVRLAFLAVLCLETAMPYGGDIRITTDNGLWSVEGTADKLNIDAGLWDALNDGDPLPSVSPAQVQFALLPVIAADLGRSPGVTRETGRITLSF